MIASQRLADGVDRCGVVPLDVGVAVGWGVTGNRGAEIAEITWLMMSVYVLFAAALVLFDRRIFFARPE